MTLSLIDLHQDRAQFKLLFKVKKDADIGYFTISLSHNPDELYAERKGEQIDLSQISTDKNMVVNQQAALWVLFFMLTEPLLEIPQDIQAINFDRVELLLYRLLTNTNQPQSKEDVKNPLLNLLKKKSQPSSKDPSLKKRIEAHKTFSFPVREKILASQNPTLEIPIMSENPITDSDLATISQIFQSLPKPLLEVMNKNQMISNLSVEIIEDDLFLTLYGHLLGEKSKATAKYDNSSAKKRRVIISRFLLKSNRKEMNSILLHELGHAVHPEQKNYTHLKQITDKGINNYHQEIVKHLKTSQHFDAVSLYSVLSDRGEFFAETVVAYLNGEVDQNPVVGSGHGPKSRLELRTKQPTIYLACRLFFEEGSPAHANPNIFSVASLNALSRMVTQFPQWLEVHQPILEIYKALQIL